MNRNIANIIKSYLCQIGYVDKIVGLVAPVQIKYHNAAGTGFVLKTFPVSVDLEKNECNMNMHQDLAPNSKYACMMYFEDGGVTLTGAKHNRITGDSRLKLVCWMNTSKIECGSALGVMGDVLNVIPDRIIKDQPGFIMMQFTPGVLDARSPQIFSRYTYDETIKQHLMHPYDYFAINITSQFEYLRGCSNELKKGGCECL